MKKHYIRITSVIFSLILVTFFVAGGFFWYAGAVRIMNERMDDFTLHMWMDDPAIENSDRPYDELIKDVYTLHWLYNDAVWRDKHVGFYGRLVLADGRTFEPRDFISIFRCDTDSLLDDNTKIIFTDEAPEGMDKYLSGVSIDAQCDDVFIYNGTLSYKVYHYGGVDEYEMTIPENEYASGENGMDFSEWIGDFGLEARRVDMASSWEKRKLDSEASEILDDFINDIEFPGMTDKNIYKSLTTCYYIDYDVTRYDAVNKAECYTIYLCHPLKIAFQEHIPVFILGLAALVIIEALLIIFMRRLYRDRMDFELRNRDLTRSIAHDLKTPLAVTQAYVENWEYIDEKDRHEYSEKLNLEVGNMNKMVNELLKMQKMDSGEQQLQLEEVELGSLAETVYNQMKAVADERGLDVTIVKDDRNGSYLVNADLEMIRIVMGNFISNAVKYAGSKVRIKIMGSDRYVTFMVTNDGEPVSNNELKKVWDAFYKKDNSRTDRIGSNGMGLAISRSILKLHKAKFGAVSDGSTVSFWFRMKRVR